MNAITPTTTSRLTLIADMGENLTAEFMVDQVTISTGAKGGISIISRDAWAQIVRHSDIFNAILGGEPLPVFERAEISQPAASVFTYPELGTEMDGGGFCFGRHPTEEGAVLVVAGIDREITGVKWDAAVKRASDGDWRLPNRLESLLMWELGGAPKAAIPGFRKGEKHAFAEEIYWTGESYEFGSDYAWSQSFAHGGSHRWGKHDELRARPVRIVRI